MSTALVEATDLTVSFAIGGGLLRRGSSMLRTADRLSLSIAPGEVLELVSEPGSGKITAGRAILRLWSPLGSERVSRRPVSTRVCAHDLPTSKISMLVSCAFWLIIPKRKQRGATPPFLYRTENPTVLRFSLRVVFGCGTTIEGNETIVATIHANDDAPFVLIANSYATLGKPGQGCRPAIHRNGRGAADAETLSNRNYKHG
jgi:energy-coupling factor transporter ATP-binding protein EcfA2